MALQTFVPVMPSGSNVTPCGGRTVLIAGLNTVLVVGHNNILRLTPDVNVNIRFGPATLTTATALDYFIPAGKSEIIDMGQTNEAMVVFAGGIGNLYYTILSRS